MKLRPLASPLASLVTAATFLAEAHAQTSQLVYSQNFNAAAIDTTGTGLNDGSNMVDNIAGYAHNRVWYSSSWGALPAGQDWKALFMTPMIQGIVSNFYMPVKNTGQSVSAFSSNFTLLNNYIGYTGGPTWGDGFSINFGKFNNTTAALGGYLGMYTPDGGTTGNVLTLSFYTYLGDAPRIELSYNGSVVASNPFDPYYDTQSPAPASAFLPVNFSYDANGVDVTYFGTSIFSNVAVAGFTPGVNDSFAMQARTGAAYQNTFVDDISINTTVAPFTWSGGAGSWTTAGSWTVGTAPTTNNNWIVMSGAGGNTNNNAVTAMQGLVFSSNASGSYVLSGNAFTNGADGIVNNSSSAQTVSSDLTLGASQTFNAANAALSFSGAINAGSNVLTLSGSNAVTINGAISGTGASLAKTGAGNLTLGGANTYSGGTTISAGRLIGTSSSLQGAITNNSALEFTQTSSGTYSGIIGGNGSFTKSGAGKLIVSGNNTYSGITTVSQGSLAVNGSLGNTAVSVGSNATLQGSGSIGGSVTINSAGTLSAGNSIESLAMGTLTLESGSNFIQEVDSTATVGLQADLVVVNGNLNIANGTTILTLTDLAGAWNWVNDTKFTMINYGGTWNGGLFVMGGDVLEDDSNIIIADGKGWRINYNDTTGGSNYSSEQTYSKFVTLTAIPEPTVVTLGGFGALLLLRRRRA
jgi:autotransporter-associated beta strand protein